MPTTNPPPAPRPRPAALPSVAAAVTALCAATAPAQIATDGSVGPAQTLTPDAANTITIPDSLGTTAGNNLFHSFSDFNVNTGQTATFTGPVNIANVISRVTGGSPSNIDGLLRTSGMPNANVFLVNPAGVIFGPGTQLDIGGSFIVTTASEIRFPDDPAAVYSAVDTDNTLLSVANPNAFGFLEPPPSEDPGDFPGSVGVVGDFSESFEPLTTANVKIAPGKSLSVIAGNVTIINGILQAPSSADVTEGSTSRLNLISVASPGTVELDPTDPDSPVDVSSFEQMGEVFMFLGSEVHVDGDGGGLLTIRSGNMTVNNSSITAFVGDFDPSTPSVDGGLIDIALTGDLTLTNGNGITTFSQDVNTGPDIHVSANNLNITNGAVLSTLAGFIGNPGNIDVHLDGTLLIDGTFSTGVVTINAGFAQDGGDITINADAISLSGLADDPSTGRPTILATTNPGAPGAGGHVTLTARVVTLDGSALIGANTISTGRGGDFTLNFTESLTISNPDAPHDPFVAAGISVQSTAEGNAGNLTINGGDTGTIDIYTNGIINTSVLSSGNSGDSHISAASVTIDGPAGIFASPSPAPLADEAPLAPGVPGNILLETNLLTMRNTAQIAATTAGFGDGGTVTVRADHILLDGLRDDPKHPTSINAQSQSTVDADGGQVIIEGRNNPSVLSLTLVNDANISTSTFGPGSAGSVSIKAHDLTVDASVIGSDSSGDAESLGNAGSIDVHASGNVDVRNHATIASSADLSDGGLINLKTDGTFNLTNSTITAEAAGASGSAGLITITAAQSFNASNSQLTAKAASTGGQVRITTTQGPFTLAGSLITAEAAGVGTPGQIVINSATTIDITDSTITGQATNVGGNMDISAPIHVTIKNSTISGRAGTDGGRITIDPLLVMLLDHTTIDGRSAGKDVIVTIDPEATLIIDETSVILADQPSLPPELDLSGSLAQFPSLSFSKNDDLLPTCAELDRADVSTFTITGAGGAPTRPDGFLPASNLSPPQPVTTPLPEPNPDLDLSPTLPDNTAD